MLSLRTASADLLGQIDTFDSDLSNWTSGANPTHIATGGPTGIGDGTGILADTLANVNIIQLHHDSATPTVPGNHPPHVVATLGIDNFEAIPEPSTLLLLLAADGCLVLRRMHT